MDKLRVFDYEGEEVRTVEKDGEFWWVLKDVCAVLEIKNPRDVTRRLEDDEKGVAQIDTLGGAQEASIINEAGLYNVILRSDKPEAKNFKRWVTHEVLPTIRKHGAYLTPDTLEAAILNPDTMIQLCQQLKSEQEKNKKLEAVNTTLTVEKQIMAPKADYFDELVDRNLLTGVRETAKQLHVPPKKFVDFLLERQYMYRDKKGKLMPYARYVEDGLFELKETYNTKTQWSGTQVLITPKGRETFRLLAITAA